MTVSSKIRLYDLALELKLDAKRLIEEVRREGVDVSVPSNSVSKELADKIRNKFAGHNPNRLFDQPLLFGFEEAGAMKSFDSQLWRKS